MRLWKYFWAALRIGIPTIYETYCGGRVCERTKKNILIERSEAHSKAHLLFIAGVTSYTRKYYKP